MNVESAFIVATNAPHFPNNQKRVVPAEFTPKQNSASEIDFYGELEDARIARGGNGPKARGS
jgi:hypothetical protein